MYLIVLHKPELKLSCHQTLNISLLGIFCSNDFVLILIIRSDMNYQFNIITNRCMQIIGIYYLCILYLATIIRPTAKLHNTSLLVKWKVFDIHFTRRMIDRRWIPYNPSIAVKGGLSWQCHFEVAVGTKI